MLRPPAAAPSDGQDLDSLETVALHDAPGGGELLALPPVDADLDEEIAEYLSSPDADSHWLDHFVEAYRKERDALLPVPCLEMSAVDYRFSMQLSPVVTTAAWSSLADGLSRSNVSDLICGNLDYWVSRLTDGSVRESDPDPETNFVVLRGSGQRQRRRRSVSWPATVQWSDAIELLLVWKNGDDWTIAQQSGVGCSTIVTRRTDTWSGSVELASAVRTATDLSRGEILSV